MPARSADLFFAVSMLEVLGMNEAEDAAPATLTPFEWMGGETKVQALVDRFYDLMDIEPGYAELRAVHGTTLDEARQKLFWFLCGWLGGPNHYIERFGHPRLRMRHMPFAIGIRERDQWVACMDQAMDETGVPPDLRTRLKESFFGTADWMRNTPGS
jgi:hemoglobin